MGLMAESANLLPDPLVFEPELLAETIARVRRGEPPATVGHGKFPIYRNDPLYDCQLFIEGVLQPPDGPFNGDDLRKQMIVTANSARALFSQYPSSTILRSLLARALWLHLRYCSWNMGVPQRNNISYQPWLLAQLFASFAGTNPKLSIEDWVSYCGAFDWPVEIPFTTEWITPGSIRLELAWILALESMIPLLEKMGAYKLPKPCIVQLSILQEQFSRMQADPRHREPARKLNSLLRGTNEFMIEPGEVWAQNALAFLQSVPLQQQASWKDLLKFCLTADGPRPRQKWIKEAKVKIAAVGSSEFKKASLDWLPLVILPKEVVSPAIRMAGPEPAMLITDQNATLLKGLVWCCTEFPERDMASTLSRLAEFCFKKIRNLGPRCPRVGNACLYTLGVNSNDSATAELTRLSQTVKQPSAKKLIGKTLDKVAESSGQTREDLEECAVPTYGLDSSGCLKQAIGGFTAECCISGVDAFQVTWRKGDGNSQKTVPAEVKEHHRPELKSLKRTIRDMEGMLSSHGRRIESFFLSEREWELETWRERYLNHPLIATLSRRLIWHFRDDKNQAAGIWRDGELVDCGNAKMEWLSPRTRVRLWHPLGQEIEEVRRWRKWLETNQVTQPFKQAHREIYILTDAELQTETYSNRFAAHIIRQHQFAALAAERGWTYRLQGTFDSHNVPTIVLAKWGLAVEFWVEPLGDNAETSPNGIYLHLSTDQVRFYDPGGGPRPLLQVPAMFFSELMRDVDLFVGVCSIASDSEWRDRGEAMGEYWQRVSFGDLSTTAKTRREILETLLPRLKIAGQCALKEKFLLVRGALRTYKIHLGSGNILMEPNDQYLCIVPGRTRSCQDSVYLPFEGDHTLAVILSKAFLLADDTEIKDETITRQIKAS